jgi:hypothetical protein
LYGLSLLSTRFVGGGVAASGSFIADVVDAEASAEEWGWVKGDLLRLSFLLLLALVGPLNELKIVKVLKAEGANAEEEGVVKARTVAKTSKRKFAVRNLEDFDFILFWNLLI